MALTKAFPRMIEGAFVSPKDFGAVGDGVTNDAAAIAAAINAANGGVVDLGGKQYAITSGFTSANVSNGVTLQNGRIICNVSTQAEYALRIRTKGDVRISNITFDGGNTVAKGLFVRSEGSDSNLFVDNLHAKNFLQTDGTGLAAGLYVVVDDRDSGDAFQSVHITNSRFTNVDSTGGSLVGRGVVVGDCRHTVVTNCHFQNIGPVEDGDGIFVQTPSGYSDLTDQFSLTNCTFQDCKKRAVKSQVGHTRISNIVCRRTVDHGDSSGQSEVSLQKGGVLDGGSFYYSSGAHPNTILTSINFSNSPIEFKNVTIFSEDPDDELGFIVTVSQQDDVQVDNLVVENFRINCRIQYLLSTIGEGLTSDPGSPNTFLFDNAVIRNIKANGFLASPATDSTSGQELSGLVFLNRSATAYIEFRGELHDISIGADDTVPTFVFNTPSGNLVYLQGVISRYTRCFGFDKSSYNGTGIGTFTTSKVDEYSPLIGSSSATFYQVIDSSVAENETFSQSFDVSREGGCKVIMVYGSRDTASTRLYTEGFVINGAGVTEYFETVAGDKTSTNTGTISVSVTGTDNTFTVSKTAGTTSASGVLQVYILNNGAVSES